MSCMTFLHVLRRPAAVAVSSLFTPRKLSNYSSFRHYSLCGMSGKKRALVFLAPGFEEIEFTTAVDVLRRGGVDVLIASTEGCEPVVGSRQIRIQPDISLADVNENFDALVLPGGLGGSETLAKCARVGEMLKEQEARCRIIAAICAAPIALKAHGIGKGKNVTSYPAMETQMQESGDYKYKTDDVVVDGYLITSRGPATAVKFALTILKELTDDVESLEVAKAMLCI